MAVLTEPAAEPMVASAPMPAPDAIAPVAAATPIAPAADGAPRGHRRPRTKRRTGRRLFQFDRGLGVRWIAGADEAGRGCLAGPLAAAAVLFDMEALGVREVRALSALNDSKQHDPEAREELYPVVMRTAVKVVVVSRCVRGIDGYGLHKTNLAALRDALATVARPGCLCLVDGFAVPDFGYPQRAIVDGDCTRICRPPRKSERRKAASASVRSIGEDLATGPASLLIWASSLTAESASSSRLNALSAAPAAVRPSASVAQITVARTRPIMMGSLPRTSAA